MRHHFDTRQLAVRVVCVVVGGNGVPKTAVRETSIEADETCVGEFQVEHLDIALEPGG